MPRDSTAPDHGDPPSPEDWRAHLEEIGTRDGFFRRLGEMHSALHVERGDTLIVTFENLDHVYDRGENRMPWGYGFVETNGWSMLGLMAHGWTWYRDEAVHDFFDGLRKAGFFSKFKRVIFYGASMGGYAAAAFSAAAPGATVILISPQATLSRDVAPWETRYRKSWRRDFASRYGYAPDMTSEADHVYLFYDPVAPLDAMHAALFSGGNVSRFRCRYFGHRIASMWARTGILKPVIHACIDGSITPAFFYGHLRARRQDMKYQRAMLSRLQEARHWKRIVRLCEAVLARQRAPRFRRALKEARTALDRRA
ncbi:MAG: phosphoadenosine phosphosulfate reductase [Boseongicola sp.]|nr:phosphoadenosine phosphosulfate reductase [Boseongicola sp.]RZW12713.1 MAG: phosphoadenosine phosphosulfate reductase [Paracoccaceae bacterium]